MLCCGYTLTDFPISIRLTSLALWQSNDCPSASKATLMNMDKYFMWIHYERLHNHNKAKHNKTVCIFLGIYCIYGSNMYILKLLGTRNKNDFLQDKYISTFSDIRCVYLHPTNGIFQIVSWRVLGIHWNYILTLGHSPDLLNIIDHRWHDIQVMVTYTYTWYTYNLDPPNTYPGYMYGPYSIISVHTNRLEGIVMMIYLLPILSAFRVIFVNQMTSFKMTDEI